MNHSGAGHLKGMAVIVGGVFVLLLLLGRAPVEALSLAVIVACPLMVVGMMLGGHEGHGGNGGHGGHDGHDGHGGHEGHGGPVPDRAAPRPGGQGVVGASVAATRAGDAPVPGEGPAGH